MEVLACWHATETNRSQKHEGVEEGKNQKLAIALRAGWLTSAKEREQTCEGEVVVCMRMKVHSSLNSGHCSLKRSGEAEDACVDWRLVLPFHWPRSSPFPPPLKSNKVGYKTLGIVRSGPFRIDVHQEGAMKVKAVFVALLVCIPIALTDNVSFPFRTHVSLAYPELRGKSLVIPSSFTLTQSQDVNDLSFMAQ